MTDYTQLAEAIRTTLLADSYLGNIANITTIETHKRGFSIQENRDALFFGEADLPAIAIVPNSGPKESVLNTTNEQIETIKTQVIGVSKDRDAQAGLTAHLSIVENIESVLEKQRSSTHDLGLDAFVRRVSTTHEQLKKGEFYYFISTTTAAVELTSNF
jgi:hypothetical protein